MRGGIARTARAVAFGLGLFCAAHHAGGAETSKPWGAEVSRPEADAAPRPAAGRRPAVHGQAGHSALAEQSSPPAGQSASAGGAISFSGTTAATLVHIELSTEVAPDVFTLANPFRVIVELPDTGFTQKAQQATHGYGLVETYRSGPFSAGKSRIVLETLGPVQATPFPITPPRMASPPPLKSP